MGFFLSQPNLTSAGIHNKTYCAPPTVNLIYWKSNSHPFTASFKHLVSSTNECPGHKAKAHHFSYK